MAKPFLIYGPDSYIAPPSMRRWWTARDLVTCNLRDEIEQWPFKVMEFARLAGIQFVHNYRAADACYIAAAYKGEKKESNYHWGRPEPCLSKALMSAFIAIC